MEVVCVCVRVCESRSVLEFSSSVLSLIKALYPGTCF